VLESHNRSLLKFHKRRNLIGLLCLVLLHGQFCPTPLSHSTNPSNLKNGSDSQCMVDSFEAFGKKLYKCFSFITSTFKSCKKLVSTSNTLIENKRMETLKHTSLHGPTIVTHSTLRLEGNSLKQINLCECDAKIKFEGFVSKAPIHFKMEK
jgi:hypothetical protein